jgi:hypothetical protein
LEIDGDEFAVRGFDEIADMGVGDLHAGLVVFPAVVAGGMVAVGFEPRRDFGGVRLGAIDERLGGHERRAFGGSQDSVEPDVIGEKPVGRVEIPQVGKAVFLRSERGGDREFDHPADLCEVEDDVLGLTA